MIPGRSRRWRERSLVGLVGGLCLGSMAMVAGGEEENGGWSWRPLLRPPLPMVSKERASWVRNPVDRFILAELEVKGLEPSAEADRRTLVRRLYFDLTGLPPSEEEMERWVADSDPRAHERLVDQLLDSPRYGERWARHWLDVVHYGDTHGYDKDKPRPNAWPYRDYVIRSFNADKPYAQFVHEQLAGDVVAPGTADGIEALGFIAAGPWDFIGHAEVPESKIDGKIARHLDRDDMVANTMNTFSSLTVHCAQCHHHKFDPISQEDYYSLHAVFAALDRADRPYDPDPKVAGSRRVLQERASALAAEVDSLQQRIQMLAGPSLTDIDGRIEALEKTKEGEGRPEFGYHSAIDPRQDSMKWVQVDLGAVVRIAKVLWAGCHDDFNGIGAGFGFPVRYRIEVSRDEAFRDEVRTVVDRSVADMANPGIEPQVAVVEGIEGRYVRITATRLAPRQNDYIFALAELEVHDETGRNLARDAAVTALDSIEAGPRWGRKNLVDGIYPGLKAADSAATLARLREERTALLARVVDPSILRRREEVQKEAEQVQGELKALPAPHQVYAGTVHHGSGAFRGTGPDGGKPRVIHVLNRGDVKSPGAEAGPGAIAGVPGLVGRFDLAADHRDGARRLALAEWLTDPANPFTWRSIVNRVWLYHFGRGIVDTPNDFGRMGQAPSHPALLDWLAVEFRDGGGSLKDLHRLLVTSATYRQTSTPETDAALRAREIDANNTLYWRMNRRRLEAEAIRDSVLFVSGRLDLSMFGPGFQDFVVDKPEHSPHYEYHLHDPDDPRTHRRSIYRFLVRSQQQPFMRTLDCADPSMLVDKRAESISALQALALLNNGFMLTMARHMATRLDAEGGTLEDQVGRGFHRALGRVPTPAEKEALVAYAAQHGLPNACRVMFNLNEFAFVD